MTIHREAWYREADAKAWETALRKVRYNWKDIEAWKELWILSRRMNKDMPEEWGNIFVGRPADGWYPAVPEVFPQNPEPEEWAMYEDWVRGDLSRRPLDNPELFISLVEEDPNKWTSPEEVQAIWKTTEKAKRLPDVPYAVAKEWLQSNGGPDLPVANYEVQEDEYGYAEPEYGYNSRVRQWSLESVLDTLRNENPEDGEGPYYPVEGQEGVWQLDLPSDELNNSSNYLLLSIQPDHGYENLEDKLEEWLPQ